MEYTKLGRTELEISRVGLGCWAIGGHGWQALDDAESAQAIRRALDLGINFFDTADVYGRGHSEEVLSKALGEERRRVVIATKFGVRLGEDGQSYCDSSPEWVEKALEASLRRLRLDCIPLYQIHWPDPHTPLEATLEALEKCRQAGKIKHIGCSNFSPGQTLRAQQSSRLESVQLAYNVLDRESESELLPLASRLEMGVIAYSPLAQGLLTGKFDRSPRFPADDVRSRSPYFEPENLETHLRALDDLRSVARRYGKTPGQVAIRWLLDGGVTCAIPGAKHAFQVEENAGAAGWKLSPADRSALSSRLESPKELREARVGSTG